MLKKNLSLIVCCGLLCLLAAPLQAQTEAAALRPFVARYHVKYRGISGGDIEFRLTAGDTPGQYHYRSKLYPNFLGRFFADSGAEDSSNLVIIGTQVRPLKFHSEGANSGTEDDIALDFDWDQGTVTGTAKNKPVALQLPEHAQDRLSIQLAVMRQLQHNETLNDVALIEGNEIKPYHLERLHDEEIRTPAGKFAATVVQSTRVTGSKVSNRYWHSAAVEYLPVRAERYKKGKMDILMELKSFNFLP